jgi:hypothetical protein
MYTSHIIGARHAARLTGVSGLPQPLSGDIDYELSECDPAKQDRASGAQDVQRFVTRRILLFDTTSQKIERLVGGGSFLGPSSQRLIEVMWVQSDNGAGYSTALGAEGCVRVLPSSW